MHLQSTVRRVGVEYRHAKTPVDGNNGEQATPEAVSSGLLLDLFQIIIQTERSFPTPRFCFVVLLSRQRGGLNALAEAVRSGSRALELLSEALVLDYVDLKFSRTLPRWDDQNPFRYNINQAFYSYTHQAQRPPSGTLRERGGAFQRLLL